MSSYLMYLVKNANLQKIRSLVGDGEEIEGTDWVRCRFRRDVSPPRDEVLFGNESLTRSLSDELGEVIFIYGDTSIDGFVYEHAQDGEILRKLVWFPMLDEDWNAGWLCVQGESEEWEETLFAENRLERFLDQEKFRFEDEGREDQFDSYAEKVRSNWSAKEIKAGQNYPECDGTAGVLVERYYRVERPA